MGRRIETDEQFDNTVKWLYEKAVELEDPLLEGEARDKLQRTFDYVWSEASRYNLERMARDDPKLRQVYVEQGFLPPQERSEQAPVQPDSEPMSSGIAHEPQEQSKPRTNLSAWLDDD